MTLRFRFLVAILPIVISLCAHAGSPGKGARATALTTQANVTYHPFLINSVFNYYANNGDGSFNRYSTNNEGFEFVKGSGKTLIFEDGVIWGGYHRGYSTRDVKGNTIPLAKVGGSVYRHGLQPGPITQYGTASSGPLAADPSDPANRVYRVRPDISPNVPFESVQDKLGTDEVQYISRYESVTARTIYDQYLKDWNEWPASLGAPFTYGRDAGGHQRVPPSSYDPRFDVPGKPGADQTLWYVANDVDTLTTAFLADSPPIGLEMQRTIWGYHRPGGISQSIFSSTILINKSGSPIDTMFFGQWSDPDIGDGGDDVVGCDTARDMGYAYNGKPSDAVYGTLVPAAGFVMLQGPIAPSPFDTAIFNMQRRPGYRNLRMTSFTLYYPEYNIYQDPVSGAGGDLQWYRNLQGLTAATGAPYIDPITNLPTKFPLSGDPVTKTGWYDPGYGLVPNDRRLMVSTGPVTMAPGDTQEIVVATAAGVGADYISSVTVLRAMADLDRSAYGRLLAPPSPPPAPNVSVGQLDGEIVLTWMPSQARESPRCRPRWITPAFVAP